jgi:hypothetical protein
VSNLLVIDYDFWFPNPLEAGTVRDWEEMSLYDWGHAETAIFLSNTLWTVRAGQFLQNGLPLPQVTVPEGGWAEFWKRFRFSDDAYLEYADSNMYAGQMTPGEGQGPWESIVLFDAHHDSGYNIDSVETWLERGRYSCEDWMVYQHVLGCDDLTVRYPTWKPAGPEERLPDGMPTKQMVDDGQPLDTVFDAVFICRSGAWVPPWCDRGFLDLVNACPVDGLQADEEQLDRQFSLADAQQMAETDRMVRAELDALQRQQPHT